MRRTLSSRHHIDSESPDQIQTTVTHTHNYRTAIDGRATSHRMISRHVASFRANAGDEKEKPL